MAFLTLEDTAGTVEAVVFPDLYKQNMLHLAKDSSVLVRGQVDVGEEIVKLLLSDVKPLADAAQGAWAGFGPEAPRGRGEGRSGRWGGERRNGGNGSPAPPPAAAPLAPMAPGVELVLPEAACTPDNLRALRDLAAQHPGPSPLCLHLRLAGGTVTVAASLKYGVNDTEAFRAAVAARLGGAPAAA
jgi:hypothetical protein